MTFTFHLRPGVKFHNGREMTADDVKYSLDRVTNPETQSPGAGFFGSIKGYDAMADGSATEPRGRQGHRSRDRRDQRCRAPMPPSCMSWRSTSPRSCRKRRSRRPALISARTRSAPAPSSWREWTIGQRLVFEKNADYWRDGLPYLDTVTFEVGQEPIVALLRLQNGEVDVPGDGIPPAKFQEVMADPEQAARVVEGGQLQTGYITLNVTTAAASTRSRCARPSTWRSTRTGSCRSSTAARCPPRSRCRRRCRATPKATRAIPYDPEAAKAMLAEAGFADGFETELFVMNTDPNPRIAQAIQQDLAAIGVKASIQSLAQANVIEAGGAGHRADDLVGRHGLDRRLPRSVELLRPDPGLRGAVEGGWNWSKYCNEALDAEATKADSMTDPGKVAERMQMWSDVYMKVMEDAPWVPVFNEQRYTMKSPRMGGADDSLRRSGLDPGQLRLCLS